MEGYKILITTSGIGSRLGGITKNTNKSLVRVGKKPAISYIIESYPEDSEFVVTIGYYGNQVKEFLEMAYPEKKFKFVEVDKYQGEGSSLLYSMLCAKDLLQCPFIFHASDTITQNYEFEKPSRNRIVYSNRENSDQYRTVNLSGGSPLIMDKGEILSSDPYIGICGINDFVKFWEIAERIYSERKNDSSLSDCDVINGMKESEWEISYCQSWLDIGSPSELTKARESIADKFDILDKDDESIFIFPEFVIKFFKDSNICKNRIERGDLLNPLSPKITGRGDNFYKYEFCKGSLFSSSVNTGSFERFLDWAKTNLWVDPETSELNRKTSLLFYREKTIERLNRFVSDNIGREEEIEINGLLVPTVKEMLDSIDWEWMTTDKFFGFHGDFILDNIIEKENGEFCLIDWRQDFGGNIAKGDMYYDLAKLNHNLLFNHEIVNKGLFSVENKNGSVRCDILRSDMLTTCREDLHLWILKNNLDLKKINTLTSIIWINMSPLHEKKMGRFLYFFGRLNLYKNLIKNAKS